MLQKIEVKICVGTSCHLMGSSLIIDFIKTLPLSVKKRLEIEYVSCFSQCNRGPRIDIGGQPILNATPEKVKKTLKSLIE